MPDIHLHIVCLDVPYPPDYGGVFDLFYKLEALYKKGVLIHLHCFEYGRDRQEELNRYCASVNYYRRKSFTRGFSFRIPLIVSTRASNELLQNLLKDQYPVLLEGIHCTAFLYSGKLIDRKIAVRLHNVEFEYYRELANATKNIFRRAYFKTEAFLLEKYERAIANKCLFLAVSEKDQHTYKKMFDARDIHYLPVFLPYRQVSGQTGLGTYCLYHGNLSVPENERAAVWLIENVFNSLEVPFYIAGKSPSGKLFASVRKNKHVTMIADPSHQEMTDLIKHAQIHVLPSFNITGVKIKLLHALFNGRHVITNIAAIEEAGLDAICSIAGSANEFKVSIQGLMNRPFDITEMNKRKKVMEKIYDNESNAQQLIEHLW